MKLEVVVKRDQVNSVVQLISGSTYTGEIGDGKIFVSPVADVIRMCDGDWGVGWGIGWRTGGHSFEGLFVMMAGQKEDALT